MRLENITIYVDEASKPLAKMLAGALSSAGTSGRNTCLLAEAIAKDVDVHFDYTDRKGDTTSRSGRPHTFKWSKAENRLNVVVYDNFRKGHRTFVVEHMVFLTIDRG